MARSVVEIELDTDQKHYDFVQQHYLKKFGTVPDRCDLLIAATTKREVVGTIALSFGKVQHSGLYSGPHFGFQNAFEIAAQHKHLAQQKHVELGRWISTLNKPKVSEILLYAAVAVARQRGCVTAFVQQRPALERILRNEGIAIKRVDAALLLENIPANDLPFYVAQPPVLNHFSLEQAAAVLQPKVECLIEDGVVEFLDIQLEELEAEA